jgi:DHA2 family multidrug resistance protein
MATAATTAGKAMFDVPRRGLLMVGIMLATVMQILDSTIANVALPHMQTSLGASYDTVTWVLTSYILASAIAMPLTGWLSDRIGSRRLFLGSVGGFIVASMLCGIATNLPAMVAFRVAQGISAAFVGPLSQTVMLDINPPERHAKAMSLWGMGVMIGPILGPILGGWLTDNYSWRWVFYINLPIGLVTLAILVAWLPSRPVRPRAFDLFGFAMLALGLAALQLMLDRGQQADWFDAWEIRVEAALAVAGLWLFAVHMATGRRTMFERAMLANRNLLIGMVFMVQIGVMMMAMMALLPPMLQMLYGYPVFDTGVLLAPRGVGILIAMFIAGQLVQRGHDPRIIVGAGMTIAALSLWQMTHWSLDMDWRPVVANGFVQGLGMGLVFPPMNALSFATLAPRFRTDAASLLYLTRSLGGSAGIAVLIALFGTNLQTSHADLVQHVTGFSLSQVDPGMAQQLGAPGAAVLAAVDAEITRQAMMIAYLDDFAAMMWFAIASVPLVLLLRRRPAGLAG